IVAEDQPYAKDASPTAQSPDYVPKSDPEEDPEEDDDEDPKEKTACYTQNRSIIIPTHEKTIVESIHLRFDEIKEISETSVANDTSGLAPQEQNPSANNHPTPEPSTPTNAHADENNDNQADFTNPFCIP
ncbi:hypothetical protein Tco_0330329, partial [Tanacetum coccineum]